MKINEIVLQEGVWDKVKKTLGFDTPPLPEPYDTKETGEVWGYVTLAERDWKEYLENLEVANNYTKLTTKQIKNHLIKFVDQHLFGIYNLETAPDHLKKSVSEIVSRLASEYSNIDPTRYGYDKAYREKYDELFRSAFTIILDQTMNKLKDDPTVKPDPVKKRKQDEERAKDEEFWARERAHEKAKAEKERQYQLRWQERNAEKEKKEWEERWADLKRQERNQKYMLPPEYKKSYQPTTQSDIPKPNFQDETPITKRKPQDKKHPMQSVNNARGNSYDSYDFD